ncbi:MAG: type IV pili twitching motility protein PilT, partial [Planctomycetaceae bacterium]
MSEGTSSANPLPRWLTAGLRAEASDLHLVAARPPVLRVHGGLQEMDGPPLDGDALRELLLPLCPETARERFEDEKHVDFSWTVELDGGLRRFRVNVFHSGRQVGACFR